MQRTFSRPRSNAPFTGGPGPVHHRSGVTSADKLGVPASPTVADVATGGSLLANTTYNCAVSAGNRWGVTTVDAVGSVATADDASDTHVGRATLAKVEGATFYDLFFSVDDAPLWIARIAEAQRAAGCTISAFATVIGTSPGAGKIDFRDVGTGVACTAIPFATNNAYTPASVTPIACGDFEYADVMAQLTVTDLRTLPSLKLVGFQQNSASSSDWVQFWTQTVSLLTAVNQPLEQQFRVAIAGAFNVVFLVEAIGGTGAAVDLWVDLE